MIKRLYCLKMAQQVSKLGIINITDIHLRQRNESVPIICRKLGQESSLKDLIVTIAETVAERLISYREVTISRGYEWFNQQFISGKQANVTESNTTKRACWVLHRHANEALDFYRNNQKWSEMIPDQNTQKPRSVWQFIKLILGKRLDR